MRLAVSNIAWDGEFDRVVVEVLRSADIDAIEVAPSRAFSDPAAATVADAKEYAAVWRQRGFEIVAVQALLFGRPDLKMFDSKRNRRATLRYLKHIIELGAAMGAGCLVFGAPKNRARGSLPEEEADEIATAFFQELGSSASEMGTAIGIEANPEEYGSDYITTVDHAARLVRTVDSPGFRLHLDSACMTLAGDDIESTLRTSSDLVAHFHASEPELRVPGISTKVDHHRFASALNESGYPGVVSIEMRRTDDPPESVAAAVGYVASHYSAS